MHLLASAAQIDYGLLEAAEAQAMAELLADAFHHGDTLALATGQPVAELRRLITAFLPQALSAQLTVLAREPSGGKLLGALLVTDFASAPPPVLDPLAPDFSPGFAPCFAPIGALLDSLDAPYRASRAIKPGSHLHLLMLGVARHAGGRGIAGQLVATCLANARRRGYTMAVTEATGSASQQVFRKQGFQTVLTAPYRDFLYQGEAIFATIREPEGTMLMERNTSNDQNTRKPHGN